MRKTLMATLVAIAVVGSAGAANATQWTYVAPGPDGACPAGSFLQPQHYARHENYVTARCAFRPQ
jgi:hypothetical protein